MILWYVVIFMIMFEKVMISLQLLMNTGTCIIEPVLCFKLIKYLFSSTEL